MHSNEPCVQRLCLHLEGEHNVNFVEGSERQALLNSSSQLLEYFKVNSDEKTPYTYVEFPKHYTWDGKKWKRRQRPKVKDVVSRIWAAHPSDPEKFYLRALLHHIRGATCFADIRTVGDTTYDSFHAAAVALGLASDDREWELALTEAAMTSSPRSMRELFAFIVSNCDVVDPRKLWTTFKDHFCEDFAHQRRTRLGLEPPYFFVDSDYNKALYEIKQFLLDSGRCYDENILPPIDEDLIVDDQIENVGDNLDDLREAARSSYDAFNPQQKEVFDFVSASLSTKRNSVVFLNAPGGCGKTFLINTLIRDSLSRGLSVAALAASGVASILLLHGRTAHSQLKLPIPIRADSTSPITALSMEGKFLKSVDLIIWDEASMVHKHNIECADRLLRQLTNLDIPFGGKTVLFSGDFRQTLPVVVHGNRADTVAAALPMSPLWRNIRIFKLEINERARARGDPPVTVGGHQTPFSQFLSTIGDGKAGIGVDASRRVHLPPEISMAPNSTLLNLIDWVYPDIKNPSLDSALLTPTNKAMHEVNALILDQMSDTDGIPLIEKLSFDSVDDVEDAQEFSQEFLNSCNFSGLPLHSLKLRVGCPVLLLRNFAPRKGLCNGTRLIVKSIGDRVIELEHIIGPLAGTSFLLPRVTLTPSDSQMPFTLRRRQFPICVSYALTINKSQGQTLQRVGVWLREPVFSHGQLYVALSRSGSPDGVRVLVCDVEGAQGYDADGLFTANVVYKEALV